jgi:hypothetical protein
MSAQHPHQNDTQQSSQDPQHPSSILSRRRVLRRAVHTTYVPKTMLKQPKNDAININKFPARASVSKTICAALLNDISNIKAAHKRPATQMHPVLSLLLYICAAALG